MDDIGIGAFLFNFASIGGGLTFLIGLLAFKFVFKLSWPMSAVAGVIFAVAGFFLAPHVFFFFLTLSGIS